MKNTFTFFTCILYKKKIKMIKKCDFFIVCILYTIQLYITINNG